VGSSAHLSLRNRKTVVVDECSTAFCFISVERVVLPAVSDSSNESRPELMIAFPRPRLEALVARRHGELVKILKARKVSRRYYLCPAYYWILNN